MKRYSFIRYVCLFLLFSTLFSSFFCLYPSALTVNEPLPSLESAESVYFSNIETGKLITKKDSGERIAPASTVKLMTGLIAAEFFADAPNTQITISSHMIAETEGTQLGLAPGDSISAENLLVATLSGGYNDAAYALAHAVAGSTQAFVSLMNERAIELGARNTNYTNPCGWDDTKMYTTLTDTVLIARAAMKNELYMSASSVVQKSITLGSVGEKTINNRNSLISSHYFQGYTNKYARGIIAGMTDAGGYCVITKAEIKDTSYLCIVMGASADEENVNSFAIADSLIHYARRNLGFVKIFDKGGVICKIPVDNALSPIKRDESEFTVTARVDKDVSAYLPLDADTEKITHKHYFYSERLSAPIENGTVIGGVDFYYEGELVASSPLVITEDIPANDFLLFVDKFRDLLLSRTFIVSLLSFVLMSAIYFAAFDRKRRKKVIRRQRYNDF